MASVVAFLLVNIFAFSVPAWGLLACVASCALLAAASFWTSRRALKRSDRAVTDFAAFICLFGSTIPITLYLSPYREFPYFWAVALLLIVCGSALYCRRWLMLSLFLGSGILAWLPFSKPLESVPRSVSNGPVSVTVVRLVQSSQRRHAQCVVRVSGLSPTQLESANIYLHAYAGLGSHVGASQFQPLRAASDQSFDGSGDLFVSDVLPPSRLQALDLQVLMTPPTSSSAAKTSGQQLRLAPNRQMSFDFKLVPMSHKDGQMVQTGNRYFDPES